MISPNEAMIDNKASLPRLLSRAPVIRGAIASLPRLEGRR